jgi:hypothetical protein
MNRRSFLRNAAALVAAAPILHSVETVESAEDPATSLEEFLSFMPVGQEGGRPFVPYAYQVSYLCHAGVISRQTALDILEVPTVY